MGWVVWWSLVTMAGAIGVVASLNSVRFSSRVAREVREMTAVAGRDAPAERMPLDRLPPPVRRYLARALDGDGRTIRLARLRHGGLFRTSLTGTWVPIEGEQHFTADPPGFIWRGRIRMAPGLWVDARDRSVDGSGNMLVMAESTVTIADSRGPELDQGALLRLLGEMAWLPTAFLNERYVRWSPVDDRRATATLQVNGRSVTGEFVFGDDGLPASFSAERYRDIGGGRAVLTPFAGRLGDFRRVEGLLVPFRVVGAWIVDGRLFEYANFEVRELQYEWTTRAVP